MGFIPLPRAIDVSPRAHTFDPAGFPWLPPASFGSSLKPGASPTSDLPTTSDLMARYSDSEVELLTDAPVARWSFPKAAAVILGGVGAYAEEREKHIFSSTEA